ncbi:hypothetical protein L0657_07245 [Dyadobacter sp. CY345]|uniref:hypothetical protein n=1 Tax=Dyadobacter sp. CY345 TaxID=2909335 RepID=UPI001F3E5703|nr:hypothetical protein [Dyadobacter sp. CY345]MCF2443746.1 hypothetical protein [Dyadobacter sp. CY345]
MKNGKYSILYLTDLYFEAKGRKYYEEDLYLTSRLRSDFEILICHPCDSYKFESAVDLIVFRNAGPVMHFKEYFDDFKVRVNSQNILSYNAMKGKADMNGKDYLIEMTHEGFPVIPTIEKLDDLHLLPKSEHYMVKLKNGADSIGMSLVNPAGLTEINLEGSVVQPFVDFIYEVSFYFIDNNFQYALYAPVKNKRWDLIIYEPTKQDLDFAKKFIDWNALSHGIQRVDACRTRNGALLLVELEDLNPYLSLNLLSDELREKFVTNFRDSLLRAIQSHKQIIN